MKRQIALAAIIACGFFAPAAYAEPVTRGPFLFACMGDAPKSVSVTFIGSDAGVARLTYKGETVEAKQELSADGALYRAIGVEFWNKGEDAVVEWRGEKMKCAVNK